ncbi:MAG: hypothetical protein AAGF92_06285 [Myxococcota bacterium]
MTRLLEKPFVLFLFLLAVALTLGADRCDGKKECSEGTRNERCATDGSETLNGCCVAGVCVEIPPAEEGEDEGFDCSML